LEEAFITELLGKIDVNWPSELANICANDSHSIGDCWEIIKDVLNTAKKVKHFSTPVKKEATDMVLIKSVFWNQLWT
jgi:hypothetical protein